MVADVPGGNRGFLSFDYYSQPFFPLQALTDYIDLESPYADGFQMLQPLVVDVVSSTPEPSYVAPPTGLPKAPEPTKEEFRMDFNDFTPIGGGVDFPSARPDTALGSLITGAFGLAQNLIEAPQVPATIPSAGTLTVNATACPVSYTPGGKLVHTHLRKQQVKARKSPVTQCVPNRHMNSLNPHALKRATRRLSGFMNHVQSAQKAIRKALGHHAGVSSRRRSARGGCVQCGRSARSCVC